MRKRIYNRVFKTRPVPQTTTIFCCKCRKRLKDFEVVMNGNKIELNTQLCTTCELKDKHK